MIRRNEDMQYRISSPLLLLFSATFIVYQMGVLYFSGNTMSLFGRTPIMMQEQGTAAVIAAGYVASILFLCLFPRRAVLVQRILLPLSLTATMLMLFPVPASIASVLFCTTVFICVFSVGIMGSVAAQHFTIDTTWRDGILCTAAGGLLIAVLQNDFFKMSFSVFVVFSLFLILGFTTFFYLIPAKIEVPYVSRKKGEKSHRMPGVLFVGLLMLIGFSSLLLCFATAFAESISNGVSLLYLSAAVMAVLLSFIKKKLGEGSIRFYGIFFMTSVFGFALAILSLSIPSLRFASVILLGFIVVIANIWIYFLALAFSFYPTRFIGAIVAGLGLVIALLHSGLIELLRSNSDVLYGIYVAVSVALMLTYYFLEPYFLYAWNNINKRIEKTFEADEERCTAREPEIEPLSMLSEQEKILTELVLKGYSGTSIAAQMNITMNTQKSYRKNIYTKLDIHSKRELFEIMSKDSRDI